jgi:hypothetical protein
MALPHPDQELAARSVFVAETEAVSTAALAFPSWKADPSALAVAGLGMAVGRQCPTQVDRCLLEHLSADLMAPSKSGHLLGDRAVWSGDEDTPGALTPLPGIEGVDQVKPRPRDLRLGSCPLGGKGIDDQPKTLVVGEPGRPGVSGKYRRLRGGGSNRVPEGGVPHSI